MLANPSCESACFSLEVMGTTNALGLEEVYDVVATAWIDALGPHATVAPLFVPAGCTVRWHLRGRTNMSSKLSETGAALCNEVDDEAATEGRAPGTE